MRLSEPPESLDVAFDMHGVRFEVLPTAQRSLSQNLYEAMYMVGFLAVGVLIALVGAAILDAYGAPTWTLGMMAAVPGLCLIVLLFYGIDDEGQRTERIDTRIGEGWLVMRHKNLGKVRRVDLTGCVRCVVVAGPDLLVHHVDQSEVRIPMRGHGMPDVGWAATAINQGIQDARYGDEPAPESLIAMLRTEG